MSNSLLTPTQVTRKALLVLHQKLRFIASINRQYDDQFARDGAKIGDTLKIREPNQYTVRTGEVMNTQDTTETYSSLQVSTVKGVDLNFSTTELTLSLDDFSDRILEPAMAVLASNIEADALTMRKDVYQQVNNTGQAITFAKLLAGEKKLTDALAPEDMHKALLNTTDHADFLDSVKGLFNDTRSLSDQYKTGVMGNTAGFDVMRTTQITQQTRGAADANYVVTTTVATQGAAAVAVQTGTGTFKQGDIITIGSVYRVHPETKATQPDLQQFVVTADSAGGSVTLAVSPAMYTTGARQNISAFPQSSAVVTVAGSISTNYGQSLLYHRDAFTFVTADLVKVPNQPFMAREVYNGISMRIWGGADITNNKTPYRIDVLYGYKTIRPQLACRLANN